MRTHRISSSCGTKRNARAPYCLVPATPINLHQNSLPKRGLAAVVSIMPGQGPHRHIEETMLESVAGATHGA